MAAFKLGIVLESLQLPLRQAIETAAALGVRGVQLDGVGDLHPDALGTTARRDFRNKITHSNLELAAVNIPLRRGLDIAEDQQPRLDHVRKVMAFAIEIGCRTVVVPLPKLPVDDDTTRANILKESLLFLGQHGDRTGVTVALEAGLDAGEAVRDYLGMLDCGLAVTYDPVNFIVNGHDAISSLVALGTRLANMQARDVRSGSLSGGAKEVAVGAGDIDWLVLAATLESLDYRGFAVVDREDGSQRRVDVENGVRFLRRFAGVMPE